MTDTTPTNVPSNFDSNSSEQIKQQESAQILLEDQQILTFVDDQNVSSYIIPHEIDPLSAFDNQALEAREHTVRDFLSRPIKLGTYTWTSSMVRNDTIVSHSFPSDLFNQTMIAEKISGFAYLKGNIRYRIVLNRQKFQAGILTLRYFPVTSPSKFYNSQLDTMTQFSGLPGIDVNIDSEEPIEIVVPFIYPNDAYDIVASPDDWASVYTRVYSPLTASSATEISLTVWAWFEKDSLELSMPTSLVSETVANTLTKYYENSAMSMKKITLNRAQIGGESSAAAKAGGPISSVTGAVSTIASVASGIPGLGAIAAPVAAAASVVSSIAGMFGFSKPTSDQIVTQVRPIFTRGMATCDNPDSSTQTALLNNNTLTEGKPIFKTECDEMAIDFITRIPHFVNSFEFSTSNAEGDLLYAAPLNPATLTSTLNSGEITTTSLGLISSMFSLWRGSLNLTFKLCKTGFHSGRILFVWFNGDLGVSSIPTTYSPDMAKNPSIQLDLQEKYELDINIPYLQATPWLNIHSSRSAFKNTNGVLAVYVVNTLQAAPSASSTIECLVEVRAGSDIEFSIPRTPELLGKAINPKASENPPIESWIALVVASDELPVYAADFSIPWDNTTIAPTVPTDGSAGTVAESTVSPIGTTLIYEGDVYSIGGGTFSAQCLSSTFEAGFLIAEIEFISSEGGFHVIKRFDLTALKGLVPFNVFVVNSPTFIINEAQIARDVAIQGIDGEKIINSIPMQTWDRVNCDTTGEVVKSIRQLLKRYTYDNNFVEISKPFGDFIVLNPNSFSALNQPSATYISLLAPAYRFYRGSRRYKVALVYSQNEVQIPSIFPVYFIPDYNSDDVLTDPATMCESTNLYILDKEGVLEFSVPYYNRNRISIVGDVTSGRLLSPVARRVMIYAGQSGNDWQPIITTNIGEDFMFGTWLGPPTLTAT